MDIPTISTALAMSNVKSQAGISLLKGQLDRMKQVGAQMCEMIEATSVTSQAVSTPAPTVSVDTGGFDVSI